MGNNKLNKSLLPISNRYSPRRNTVPDGYILAYDALSRRYVPIQNDGGGGGGNEANSKSYFSEFDVLLVADNVLVENISDKDFYIENIMLYAKNITGTPASDYIISLGYNSPDYDNVQPVVALDEAGQTFDSITVIVPAGESLVYKITTIDSGYTSFDMVVIVTGSYF